MVLRCVTFVKFVHIYYQYCSAASNIESNSHDDLVHNNVSINNQEAFPNSAEYFYQLPIQPVIQMMPFVTDTLNSQSEANQINNSFNFVVSNEPVYFAYSEPIYFVPSFNNYVYHHQYLQPAYYVPNLNGYSCLTENNIDSTCENESMNEEASGEYCQDNNDDLDSLNEERNIESDSEIKANENFSICTGKNYEAITEFILSTIENEDLEKSEKFEIISKEIIKNDFIVINKKDDFIKIINFLPFDTENSKYKFIILFRKTFNFRDLDIENSINFLCRIFDEHVSHENRKILIRYFFENRFVEFSQLRRLVNHIINNEEKSLFDKTTDFIDVSYLFEYIKIDRMDSETLISLLKYEKSMNKKGFSLDFNRYLIQFIQKLDNETEVQKVIDFIFLNCGPEFINSHYIYFEQELIARTILKISNRENADTILNGINVAGFLAADIFLKDVLLAFHNENIEEVKKLSLEFEYYGFLTISSANQLISLYRSFDIIEYAAFVVDKTTWPANNKLNLWWAGLQRLLTGRFTYNFKFKSEKTVYFDTDCDFFNCYIICILSSEYYDFLLDERFIWKQIQKKSFKRLHFLGTILQKLMRVLVKKRDPSVSLIKNFIFYSPFKFRRTLVEYLISEMWFYINSNKIKSEYLSQIKEEIKRINFTVHSLGSEYSKKFLHKNKSFEGDHDSEEQFFHMNEIFKIQIENITNIYIEEKRKYFANLRK